MIVQTQVMKEQLNKMEFVPLEVLDRLDLDPAQVRVLQRVLADRPEIVSPAMSTSTSAPVAAKTVDITFNNVRVRGAAEFAKACGLVAAGIMAVAWSASWAVSLFLDLGITAAAVWTIGKAAVLVLLGLGLLVLVIKVRGSRRVVIHRHERDTRTGGNVNIYVKQENR